ncbi:MAG TPA: hypothetical protein VF519_12825 [Mycobacteriales bacterium]|jgi:hypothetical protein
MALVDEAEVLESVLASWQVEPLPDASAIAEGRRRYEDWYARARAVVPASDAATFQDMYEGGQWTTRIKSYLGEPQVESPLHDPKNPVFPRWKVPFDGTPRDSLATQRTILRTELHRVAAPAMVLDELSAMFRRLPEFLDVLRAHGNDRVPPPDLQNEADLQALVHALLRVRFGDVRAEDPVPQYAGRSTRTDFLLREAGVLVETKFTRTGLRDKQLGDELLQDLGRYPRHPDCRAIFVLIYDPARQVLSPDALEADLSSDKADLPIRAIVVR